MFRLYNEKDARSIERHGKVLLKVGTLRRAACSIPIPKASLLAIISGRARGSFGKLLEENYYGIKPGNSSAPDFPIAKVELKSTPLLLTSGGLFKAKERLVLGIINYRAEVLKTFKQSVLRKNARIMLVSYEHKDDRPVVDHPVRIAQIVEYRDLPKKDRLIIERDWKVIHSKIIAGKAHEISEGDTLYLAACTKGADGTKVTSQHGSDIKAKTRAFSFKAPYMTAITRRILNPEEIHLHEPLVRNAETLRRKTIGDTIDDRFRPFIGLSVGQINRRVGRGLNTKTKDHLAQLSRRILGIKGKRIEEFENAGIVMKTVRLTPRGTPKEDMSFPYFKFRDLVQEKWDGDPDAGEIRSRLQVDLERKVLFVVFQMEKEGEMRLAKVFLWHMPARDLVVAKSGWLDTQRKIARSDVRNLLKISDDKIIHVRPHGRNSKDTNPLPNGRPFTKLCFWLNKSYVAKIIQQN